MPVQSPRSLGVGVLLLSLGLMFFELSLTRVLSVLYYYHTAFLAISIAMLGLGAGGLWVHLFPRLFAGRKRVILAVTALSMGLLPPLFPVIHLELSQLDQFLGGRFILTFGITVMAGLLPFLGGGAVFTMTLQENHDRVARLYAADLTGAAGGTLLLVPAMDLLGGPGALFSCGAIVAVASFFLAGRSHLTILTVVAVLGLGSRLAHAWIQRPDAAYRLRTVLVLLVITLIIGTGLLARLLRPELNMSQVARIAMTFAALGLPGLLMGMPMAIGLAFVGGRPGIAIPWAWGINGAAGVIASVGAIFLAVLFGFTLALTAGVACYVVALMLRPIPQSTNRY